MSKQRKLNREETKPATAALLATAMAGLGLQEAGRTVSGHVRLVTLLARRAQAVADMQNRKLTVQPAHRSKGDV